MADIKQLKAKIQSTKNIKKITNAMEIISTIKLQKVKKNAEHLREYMITFLGMLSSIDTYTSLFPKPQSNKYNKELAILISSEKGLCGSLNTLLFKQFAHEYDHRKSEIDVFVVGKKAKEYCTRKGYTVAGHLSLKDVFTAQDIDPLFEIINRARKQGSYAKIKVRYNYFKNTMKQIPA
jgi:F-type H+-transporting ATPase subunit gamma